MIDTYVPQIDRDIDYKKKKIQKTKKKQKKLLAIMDNRFRKEVRRLFFRYRRIV